MLAVARARIDRRDEPFWQAWEAARASADEALHAPLQPFTGDDHRGFFRMGRAHAFACRHLALVHRLSDGPSGCGEKAADILLRWARGLLDHPTAASDDRVATGAVLGRVVSLFCGVYALLRRDLDAAARQEIEAWFHSTAARIRSSQRVLREEQGRVSAELAAQNMGLVSIGHVLADHELLHDVLRDPDNPCNQWQLMAQLILMPDKEPDWYRRETDPTYTKGAPAPLAGEMYDRFQPGSASGAHFALLSLRFLTLVAEAVRNNAGDPAQDLYAWVGPSGERLELSYEVYSDLDFTNDDAARVNRGYYAGQHVTYRDVPMYELAHLRYPGNERIRSVLERHRRVVEDLQTFGWTAILTHGLDDVAPCDSG
jgi:hypothetical protein